MKNSSIVDLTAFLALKLLGPLVRRLPRPLTLRLGRSLGEALFLFDPRHRSVVHANLCVAFGHAHSPAELRRITLNYYRCLGQNILEIFLIPLADRAYIQKNVVVTGKENADQAFREGKGVIFAGVHGGNWELSGLVCASLGYSYGMLVRNQRMELCGRLLNEYRRRKGCRILDRDNQLRQVVSLLRENGSVGITVDQGGADGIPVRFFGKNASMAQGAVRMALKLEAKLVPVFCSRLADGRLEFNVNPAMSMIRTGDAERDVAQNLQRLVAIFEEKIEKSPQEYLWSYKVWKHGNEKSILIISDGKTGHVRQSQSLARIVADELGKKGLRTDISVVPAVFKSTLSRKFLLCPWFMSGPYVCQGCLACLRRLLTNDSYVKAIRSKADFIISCGSSVAPIAYLLSRQRGARSLAVMKPPWHWNRKRFDLQVIARHDLPAGTGNVVVTEGALNLIDPEYLESQRKALEAEQKSPLNAGLKIGLLIGGNAGPFRLTAECTRLLARQVLEAAEKLDAQVLATTSRRTPGECAAVIKEELGRSRRCPLLILANERNSDFAVGGILGLSSMCVCTPESISMLSEAASSGAAVFTFNAQDLKARHRNFLRNLARKKHIHVARLEELAYCLAQDRARHGKLDDRRTVAEAVNRLIS